MGTPAYVETALRRLLQRAEAGVPLDDLIIEAQDISAEWWLLTLGTGSPDGLEELVAELGRWCAVAASHYALRCDHLNRAGCKAEAALAARQAASMEKARDVLTAMLSSRVQCN